MGWRKDEKEARGKEEGGKGRTEYVGATFHFLVSLSVKLLLIALSPTSFQFVKANISFNKKRIFSDQKVVPR